MHPMHAYCRYTTARNEKNILAIYTIFDKFSTSGTQGNVFIMWTSSFFYGIILSSISHMED